MRTVGSRIRLARLGPQREKSNKVSHTIKFLPKDIFLDHETEESKATELRGQRYDFKEAESAGIYRRESVERKNLNSTILRVHTVLETCFLTGHLEKTQSDTQMHSLQTLELLYRSNVFTLDLEKTTLSGL